MPLLNSFPQRYTQIERGLIMQPEAVSPNEQERLILEKIRMLPPEKVAEVADFVDFIAQRDQTRTLIPAAGKIAEPSFEKVWGNSEDGVYDRL